MGELFVLEIGYLCVKGAAWGVCACLAHVAVNVCDCGGGW